MIDIINDLEVKRSTKRVAEIPTGTAFTGVVKDIDGFEQEGVFVRAKEGIFLLDDLEAEFETVYADDEYSDLAVADYNEVDITVRVDGYSE